MAELILAVDRKGGIGYKGQLPWKCRDDLLLFSQKTMGKTLLVGRVTLEKLPFLHGRSFICLSRKFTSSNDIPNWVNKDSTTLARSLDEIFKWRDSVNGPLMVIGGAQIYQECLRRENFIRRIHISIMDGEYQCDTYFDMDLLRFFTIEESERYNQFTHYVLTNKVSWEAQYLDLLTKILRTGEVRQGRNGETKAIFKHDFQIDLRLGFPLVTTKKMFFRGIVEELLFFLRGETDSTRLEESGVHIWKANTSRQFLDSLGLDYPEGCMGPMYGYQWRSYGAPYDPANTGKRSEKGIDQLRELVELIRRDPMSRRLLLTTYNPSQAKQGVLYPCHSIVNQFFVQPVYSVHSATQNHSQTDEKEEQSDYLDMYVYNRSSDVFLGLPFNIASSALLLHVVAHLTDKTPRFLYLTTGDTHIYASHLPLADHQTKQPIWSPPRLQLPSSLQTLDTICNLSASDFKLIDYQSHPSIKAHMIA